jgi:hypothetical protein
LKGAGRPEEGRGERFYYYVKGGDLLRGDLIAGELLYKRGIFLQGFDSRPCGEAKVLIASRRVADSKRG